MVEDRGKDRVTPGRNGGGDPGGFWRIEVITGVGRRRRWSEEEKAEIVAASFAPGVGVRAVSRRYDVCPSLIYQWRRQFSGAGSGGGAPVVAAPAFVPVVVGGVAEAAPSATAGVIEVVVGGVTVRVCGAVDGAALGQVLAVVRRL